MNTFQLGIDVAKAKLDCALRSPQGKLRHKVLENTSDGFQALRVWLDKQGVEDLHYSKRCPESRMDIGFQGSP